MRMVRFIREGGKAMYLPDFNYYCPHSVQEACAILADLGAGAKVLAGGTDLLIKMKHELVVPKALVSLKNIRSLADIGYVEGKGLILGARCTHNDLVNSTLLHQRYLSVAEAAHQMANNQIRNIGTVGGNLVNAVPSADLPPILIALGAQVTLVGPGGERTLPLEQFFTGPGQTVIAHDEILTEVVIPDQSTTGSTYIKFGLRRSGALAVVGVAAAVTVVERVIREARIVLGAVAPTPIRAREAEERLVGNAVSTELLEEAGIRAATACKPISDIRASAEYRRDLVRVLTKRSLRRAIEQGHV